MRYDLSFAQSMDEAQHAPVDHIALLKDEKDKLQELYDDRVRTAALYQKGSLLWLDVSSQAAEVLRKMRTVAQQIDVAEAKSQQQTPEEVAYWKTIAAMLKLPAWEQPVLQAEARRWAEIAFGTGATYHQIAEIAITLTTTFKAHQEANVQAITTVVKKAMNDIGAAFGVQRVE